MRYNMRYNNENLLEMVEMYAEEVGAISSEEMLSELFDYDIVQSIIEEYSEDDTVAINEGFTNWSDMLCKDGEIHPEQYQHYCYVGKYS